MLGGLGGVRLLLLASSGLLRRLLALLGCLTRRVLGLACDLTGLVGCLSCSVLRLLGGLACGVLGLPCYLSGLIRGLSSGALDLSGNLSHLVGDPAQRSATALAFTLLLLASAGEPAGETTHGVLRLARYLSCLVGCLTGYLLGLACYLPGLVGCLTRYLLGLARYLSGGILRLLGCSLRDLLHLLQGLLGSLVHRFLDTRILGRLIHGALELHVGVDHLLDLGLLATFGELLRILLQLFAVILSLALDPTQRLPVEVLSVFHGLLLQLLL